MKENYTLSAFVSLSLPFVTLALSLFHRLLVVLLLFSRLYFSFVSKHAAISTLLHNACCSCCAIRFSVSSQ